MYKNISIYKMMERKTKKEYKEAKAIKANNTKKYERDLFNNLQTDRSKKYVRYIDKYLKTCSHTGNPTRDISIDRETIAAMTDNINDMLKKDSDFVEEIFLNKEDNINSGREIYDLFTSFIRSLLLTELLLNRQIGNDLNINNIELTKLPSDI